MAVKSRAPAKKAAKAPARSGKASKAAARPPRSAVAKAAKPVAAKKPAAAKKAPASHKVVKAAKPVPKPAGKAPAAPKKAAGVPHKEARREAPPKAIRPEARPAKVTPPPAAPGVMPAPRPVAVKPPPTVNPQDVAAAHEYLLTRSATRSSEPVFVNGRRLPTEEELLKMPESAYMNDDQLAFFKYRLQQMERELLANADETTEHLRETVIVPDPADRATIEEEHALELRTRDRERKLLKKVQASLAAIERGEYGYCEETGEPIGIPRLLARPTATLSLEAQQRRELKQKLYGD